MVPFGPSSPGENDNRLAVLQSQMLARAKLPPGEVDSEYQEQLRLERLKNAAFLWTLVVLAVAGAVTWLEGTELAAIVTVVMTGALLGLITARGRGGR